MVKRYYYYKKNIESSFQKAGNRNNFYLTDDEEKTRESYRFDFLNGMLEIEDDLGNELNVNAEEENKLEDII